MTQLLTRRILRSVFVASALLTCAGIGATQGKPGTVVAAAGQLIGLTTVVLNEGKVVRTKNSTVCVAKGGLTTFNYVAQREADSNCKLVQGAKVAGDFFRLSCDGGATSILGSLRKQSDEGFTSAYVLTNGTSFNTSKGTVGRVLGDC
jgi:hypothetical protein